MVTQQNTKHFCHIIYIILNEKKFYRKQDNKVIIENDRKRTIAISRIRIEDKILEPVLMPASPEQSD